jgi:hypothetical protein
MTGEQRWAASGVVVLLGVLWAAVGVWTASEPYRWEPPGDDMTGGYVFAVGVLVLGLAVLWLVTGLVTVARVGSGQWRWHRVALLWGGAALLTMLAAVGTWSLGDEVGAVLIGFSAVALLAYAALLRTPAPTPVGADGSP